MLIPVIDFNFQAPIFRFSDKMNDASHSANLNATTVRSIRTSYLIASSLLGYENKSTVLSAQIPVTSLKMDYRSVFGTTNGLIQTFKSMLADLL